MNDSITSYEVVVSTDKECFVLEQDNYYKALEVMGHWLKQPECKGREVFVQRVTRTKLNSFIGGK